MQLKATETSSIHLEKEMEKEADKFAGKEARTKSEMRRKDPVPLLDNSNSSSSLKEMGCREEETEWNDKTNRTRNNQGKDPRISEEKNQGEDGEELRKMRWMSSFRRWRKMRP